MSASGIRIFKSVEEAQAAGFAVFERIPDGYLVRKTSGNTFALAIVKLTPTIEPRPGDIESADRDDSSKAPANVR
ncbi:MAG: hypothetical protein M3Z37_00510 [Candidatus Eremiobacteraeota bacterium]|nr:hypothetical protein [Candidatus Eremiobacteraeota bacterium]